ncbi:DHA2 family efflux MFS transporter permease subunit [Phytomonospora endophytica]|uniref:EmrB/QacA subfamily drug resistance transporter n=1 Tax=Phytomonospora endophytica TaxID=714109 RepID=A0A841G091_9ACTN|nr:DHA2 family efflux MFS transporter permease subunit [Phytomonospora endophytica]MBB6039192.1 EmrB/QacA subfamily drug resistance transporter [Phytomonospora endophytica]GIG67571.1 MFS transporter [Phytomonospora endophytica]
MTRTEDRLEPAVRRTVAVILLGGIMGILDGSMVVVAADTLAGHFGSSLAVIGWASTGYLLALTIAVPVTAWAVDRVGGRRLWLFGLVLFLAGSVASGLAWDVGPLIVFRVVQGAGAGILDPLMLTLLVRTAGPGRSGRVVGLMGAVGSAGPVVGPIVGGLIVQSLDWRWMFFVNVPIVIVAFVLARRVLPVDRPAPGTARTRLDVVGVALIGPGVAASVLALSQAAEHGGFTTPYVVAPLAVGLVLVGLYVSHALRRTEPLIDPRMFAHRGFPPGVLVLAFNGVTTYGALFALPLFYQQASGDGPFAAGLLLAPLGIGAVISMPLAGRLSDRLGSRNLAVAGSALTLLSALAFTFADSGDRVLPAVASLAIGLGLGCASAPTMSVVFKILPPERVAQGSSLLYMLNQLGASLGITVAALLIQSAADPATGFRHTSWALVVAATAMLAATTRVPGRTPAPVLEGASL